MGLLKILVASGALALAMTNLAAAADMPEIPTIDSARAFEPELGTNWYLRGDIGYKIDNDPIQALDIGYLLPSAALDSDWTFGLGIGYDFGWLRMDLTSDYMYRNYDRNISDTTCGIGGAQCHFEEENTGQAFTTLINAYFDLGTWSGLTPYVGVGIGAYTQLTNNDGFGVCTAGGGVCPPPFDAAGGRADINDLGGTRSEFAYALMAGASYAINQNLAIDAGYRYLWIHDGQAEMNLTTGEVSYSSHHTNEVRVGFRYTID